MGSWFVGLHSVIASHDLVVKLPTIITDRATLHTLNKSEDVIYRDELVYRWSSCDNRSQLYPRAMKLRGHYQINH